MVLAVMVVIVVVNADMYLKSGTIPSIASIENRETHNKKFVFPTDKL